jgi:hypothetical protein
MRIGVEIARRKLIFAHGIGLDIDNKDQEVLPPIGRMVVIVGGISVGAFPGIYRCLPSKYVWDY